LTYSGSCLCAGIQYEISGEFESFFFCHCRFCRKDTGSAHAANLFSSTAELRWLKGGDRVRTYDHENSGHIKSFCPDCGSALPNLQRGGSLLMVPAGSLDSDLEVVPNGHIYLSQKANWDHRLEDLPRYGTLPGEDRP